MKLSKNELLKVARVFAQRLKETGVKVKSIIVGGSVLRDDFVSGFSDIDVYVFVSHSEIDSNFFINLRGVLEDIEKEFRVNLRPDVFFVEDLPVLLNRRVGVNDLIEKRLVIFGKDILNGVNHGDLISVARRTIAFDEEVIRRMLYLSPFDKNSLKRAIKICISVAKVCLFFKGKYLLDKRDIIREFKQAFPEFSKHFSTLDKAYELRVKFSSLCMNEREIRDFILSVYEFLKDVKLHFRVNQVL